MNDLISRLYEAYKNGESIINHTTSNKDLIKINTIYKPSYKDENDETKYKYNNILCYTFNPKERIYLCFNNKKDKIKFINDLYINYDLLEGKRFLEYTIHRNRKFWILKIIMNILQMKN